MFQLCLDSGAQVKHDWHWIDALLETPLAPWLDRLPAEVERVWREKAHGDLPAWQDAIERLPHIGLSSISLTTPRVRAGVVGDCDDAARLEMRRQLMRLHPWRKGPFEICGLLIDTEWRSDLKWDRLRGEIASLKNRLVLDVGCGNGYHAWRMVGEGARQVIGIDPTQLFLFQFEAMRRFLGSHHPVQLLPLGIEDLPPDLQAFDTVFSMGVFYHRRSPFSHLSELKGCLRKGGELVLETLVIEGGEGEVLVPRGRYAKMRNVWFIPAPATLVSWLMRAGFDDIRLIDVSATTLEEQRCTEWMRFESLTDYLDPTDQSRTLEGYPAPRRAIILARA
jgi:tRNA (mo5U34)-methyltransferase